MATATIDLSKLAGLFVGPNSKKTPAMLFALGVSAVLMHFNYITYEQFQTLSYVFGSAAGIFATFMLKKLFGENAPVIEAPTKEDLAQAAPDIQAIVDEVMKQIPAKGK